jgi:hypothetical protein
LDRENHRVKGYSVTKRINVVQISEAQMEQRFKEIENSIKAIGTRVGELEVILEKLPESHREMLDDQTNLIINTITWRISWAVIKVMLAGVGLFISELIAGYTWHLFNRPGQ